MFLRGWKRIDEKCVFVRDVGIALQRYCIGKLVIGLGWCMARPFPTFTWGPYRQVVIHEGEPWRPRQEHTRGREAIPRAPPPDFTLLSLHLSLPPPLRCGVRELKGSKLRPTSNQLHWSVRPGLLAGSERCRVRCAMWWCKRGHLLVRQSEPQPAHHSANCSRTANLVCLTFPAKR